MRKVTSMRGRFKVSSGITSRPTNAAAGFFPDRFHTQQVEDFSDVVAFSFHGVCCPNDDADALRVFSFFLKISPQ